MLGPRLQPSFNGIYECAESENALKLVPLIDRDFEAASNWRSIRVQRYVGSVGLLNSFCNRASNFCDGVPDSQSDRRRLTVIHSSLVIECASYLELLQFNFSKTN